jgi:hypothetical protein
MDRVNIATIDDAVYKAAEEGSQTKDFYILVDIDGLETKLEFDLSQAAALECVRIDLGGDHGLLLEYYPERLGETKSTKFIREVIPDLHHAICELEDQLDIARGSYAA